MASIVFASSPLSGQSSVVKRLRTNSKYPRHSWILNSSSKASYCVQHLSYKNFSLESSKSSYIQGDGFSAFSLQKFSRVATEKPPSLNTITSQKVPGDEKSIYRFTAKRNGKAVSLKEYDKKILLIVNIPKQGSEWTKSEYEKLHRLYEKYKGRGFEILGFLYDKKETGKQGYGGGSKEINTAQFPLFDKVKLNDEHKKWYSWFTHQKIDEKKRDKDLWYFLKHKAPGGGDVEEEFVKFLVDWQGIPLGRFDPFSENKTSGDAQPGGTPSNILEREDPRDPVENEIKRYFP